MPRGRPCKYCSPEELRERRRRENLKQNHGIDTDAYDAIWDYQNGRCAICKTELGTKTGKRLAVDHDHSTGAIRGLLCASCNMGLGYFKDDVERLRAAIVYLQDNLQFLPKRVPLQETVADQVERSISLRE